MDLSSRAEKFNLLTQTAADAPMGKLLRKFWQPIAVSKDLAPGAGQPIRVLGEDLTLYRGESGRAYLVGGRCAHRLTLLHTGWIEGDNIRCMYHGWQYDGTGQCVHRPVEQGIERAETGAPAGTAGAPVAVGMIERAALGIEAGRR